MKDKIKLTASQEDYLEVIAHIIAVKKVARAKVIAAKMNVSRSSVTEAFRSLSKKGLINYAPYEVITLTDLGEEMANDVIFRHNALKEFFIKILSVDEQLADSGACRIEHAAPPEIIDRFIQFVKFVEVCPRGGAEWIKSFDKYYRKGFTVKKDCRECISLCLEKK
jgi:DtxR family Mn-dependent transcriptional regulator